MSSGLQKSLNRLSTGTAQVDKSVNAFVRNDTYVNILRVSLVCYSLFVDQIPNDIIYSFQNFGLRLLVSASVAYLLFKDVITALLLALCFILSVQELKKRKHGVPHNNAVGSHGPSPNPISSVLNSFAPDLSFGGDDNGNPEDNGDPAFKTMTQNLVEGGAFTTDAHLKKASSNLVQGVDPDVGVKTFVNQHGAQGLDVPLGVDPDACSASGF